MLGVPLLEAAHLAGQALALPRQLCLVGQQPVDELQVTGDRHLRLRLCLLEPLLRLESGAQLVRSMHASLGK